MSKFSFEDLHRNHACAFLDGLLSGALLTGFGIVIYKEIKEGRRLSKELAELDKQELEKNATK